MRIVAGGVIAVVLLGIYAWLIATGAALALCSGPACAAPAAFNSAMQQALAVITGLVSALVIAELAVTPVGGTPAARLLPANCGVGAKTILHWVTVIYLVVWLVGGLAAFVIGLLRPDAVPSLTEVGHAWFGIAIAAAYAYLGIRPAAS